MTYEEFKVAYANNFKLMMSYKPNECGSWYYSEKLADLSDAYPDLEVRMEEELEAASVRHYAPKSAAPKVKQ